MCFLSFFISSVIYWSASGLHLLCLGWFSSDGGRPPLVKPQNIWKLFIVEVYGFLKWFDVFHCSLKPEGWGNTESSNNNHLKSQTEKGHWVKYKEWLWRPSLEVSLVPVLGEEYCLPRDPLCSPNRPIEVVPARDHNSDLIFEGDWLDFQRWCWTERCRGFYTQGWDLCPWQRLHFWLTITLFHRTAFFFFFYKLNGWGGAVSVMMFCNCSECWIYPMLCSKLLSFLSL